MMFPDCGNQARLTHLHPVGLKPAALWYDFHFPVRSNELYVLFSRQGWQLERAEATNLDKAQFKRWLRILVSSVFLGKPAAPVGLACKSIERIHRRRTLWGLEPAPPVQPGYDSSELEITR